jgi:hypothetical protein
VEADLSEGATPTNSLTAAVSCCRLDFLVDLAVGVDILIFWSLDGGIGVEWLLLPAVEMFTAESPLSEVDLFL